MADDDQGPVATAISGCFNIFLLLFVAPFVLITALVNSFTETVPESFSEWEAYSSNAYKATKPGRLANINALKSAAARGDDEAQYWLGEAYSNGDEVIKNYEDAYRMYENASHQGNLLAKYKVGSAYCKGQGATQDFEKGFESIASSSALSPQASISVGVLAELGVCSNSGKLDGTPFFNLAVSSGGVDYTSKIAFIYARGKGLPKNDDKAIYWYRSGAIQGSSEAQSSLGFLLAGNTLGETENMIAPYAWLSIALANSVNANQYQLDSIKDKLKQMEAEMSSTQVSRAQEVSKRCVQTNFYTCPI